MPAGQSQEPDNSLGPLWITIGVFIALGFIWISFKTQIIGMIFTIRMWEANAISIFVPSIWAQHLDSAKEFMLAAKQAHYSGITFHEVINVSNAIGYYLRIPVVVILCGLAILIYINNPVSKFKKTHSMKSLLQHELPIWPHIIPVSKLNLIDQDIHKGPWAMALTPMEFAKRNNLLKFEKGKTHLQRLESRAAATADVLRDEARKIFALQLGRYYSGPEAMPIHYRALYAIFCARANGDRDSSGKLQEQISRSSSGDKLNFSGVDDVLRKHKDNKNIVMLCKRHAFELTVMASMLEFARQDGVLPSAEFLWLKPIDRRLWFLLNSVGRQTPFSEVAGIYGHWIAEKAFGKPLNVPMVEEAVNGLENAIKEIVYKPEEDD
jgi:intracellular multiplication protein IcmP